MFRSSELSNHRHHGHYAFGGTWLEDADCTPKETDMDLGLKDRVALVAAASRSIGYAAARELPPGPKRQRGW